MSDGGSETFRSCPSCRGQGKLEIRVDCPECHGEGSITRSQVVAKLGDLLSPETIDKIAEMLVEADRDRLNEFR